MPRKKINFFFEMKIHKIQSKACAINNTGKAIERKFRYGKLLGGTTEFKIVPINKNTTAK
jgi:hypothetical protein